MRPNYLPCSGESWEKARMQCLVRDNFTCQHPSCKENRLRFLQVHHIKMRINGGSHDLDNLITLCREHHAEIHPHMKFELSEKDNKVFDMSTKEL